MFDICASKGEKLLETDMVENITLQKDVISEKSFW